MAETVRQLGTAGTQCRSVLAVKRRVEECGRAEHGDDQREMALMVEHRRGEGVDTGQRFADDLRHTVRTDFELLLGRLP